MLTAKNGMKIIKSMPNKKEKNTENKTWIHVKKDKNYYENNKEAIRARRSVKTAYGCGGSYVRDARAQHFRTKKHQDWLNQQKE